MNWPWLLFIVSALATFRLSVMLAKEAGPGRVFSRLRLRAHEFNLTLAQGLECPRCLSVWFAAGLTVYVVWMEWLTPAIAPVWWLAVSGVAVLLSHWIEQR